MLDLQHIHALLLQVRHQLLGDKHPNLLLRPDHEDVPQFGRQHAVIVVAAVLAHHAQQFLSELVELVRGQVDRPKQAALERQVDRGLRLGRVRVQTVEEPNAVGEAADLDEVLATQVEQIVRVKHLEKRKVLLEPVGQQPFANASGIHVGGQRIVDEQTGAVHRVERRRAGRRAEVDHVRQAAVQVIVVAALQVVAVRTVLAAVHVVRAVIVGHRIQSVRETGEHVALTVFVRAAAVLSVAVLVLAVAVRVLVRRICTGSGPVG